jgi:hypothetical protein
MMLAFGWLVMMGPTSAKTSEGLCEPTVLSFRLPIADGSSVAHFVTCQLVRPSIARPTCDMNQKCQQMQRRHLMAIIEEEYPSASKRLMGIHSNRPT